jgi:hypothetical protein
MHGGIMRTSIGSSSLTKLGVCNSISCRSLEAEAGQSKCEVRGPTQLLIL